MIPIYPLSDQLAQVLLSHQVQVLTPRKRMTQLNAVVAGSNFTKPRTNVLLLHPADRSPWNIFVDDDFHYLGDDPQLRQLFGGLRHRRWLELTPPEPVEGSVNDAILCVLDWLDSPMRHMIGDPHRRAVPPQQIEAQLEQVGRVLQPDALETGGIQPTAGQADAIARVAEVTARSLAPNCPILCGVSGSGKSMVARLAAGRLVERGVVGRVVEISGAAVCSGAIFLPERDERLRKTLEIACGVNGTLVILEHADLALAPTETAQALLADYLDAGLRLIGVARSDFAPRRGAKIGALARRIEVVPVEEPELVDLQQIVRRQFEQHPLSRKVEFPPETLATILTISRRRPGHNPAEALGLLEAALVHADWAGLESISPDDLYHLAQETDESSFD